MERNKTERQLASYRKKTSRVFRRLKELSGKNRNITKAELLEIARNVFMLKVNRAQQRLMSELLKALDEQTAFILVELETRECQEKIRRICHPPPPPPPSPPKTEAVQGTGLVSDSDSDVSISDTNIYSWCEPSDCSEADSKIFE